MRYWITLIQVSSKVSHMMHPASDCQADLWRKEYCICAGSQQEHLVQPRNGKNCSTGLHHHQVTHQDHTMVVSGFPFVGSKIPPLLLTYNTSSNSLSLTHTHRNPQYYCFCTTDRSKRETYNLPVLFPTIPALLFPSRYHFLDSWNWVPWWGTHKYQYIYWIRYRRPPGSLPLMVYFLLWLLFLNISLLFQN